MLLHVAVYGVFVAIDFCLADVIVQYVKLIADMSECSIINMKEPSRYIIWMKDIIPNTNTI